MALKSWVIRGFVKPSGYIYASDDQHYYFQVHQVKGAIENHQTIKFSLNNAGHVDTVYGRGVDIPKEEKPKKKKHKVMRDGVVEPEWKDESGMHQETEQSSKED